MIVMRSEHGTTHDQQRRLFCSPADADRHLASISALKAWFGIPDHGPDWALPTSAGPLSVHVANETWNADTRSYTSDGTVDGIDFDAFVTVRSIVHSLDRTVIIPGTEIWVHIALAHHHQAAVTRRRIAHLVERGLDHLTAELDCQPGTDTP